MKDHDETPGATNMAGEKRRRDDAFLKMLGAMRDANRELYDVLVSHMQSEENQRREILERLAPLDDLIESLPRDPKTGKPSTYLHRVQHSVISDNYDFASSVKKGVAEKIGMLLAIGVVVLITSGNWTKVLAALAGN